MSKTKLITDYVPAKISRLRVDEAIPVDLHLYFQSNEHILLWQPAGAVFTVEMLARYKNRGLEQVWVHKSVAEKFFKYLNGSLNKVQNDGVEYSGILSTDHFEMPYLIVAGSEESTQDKRYKPRGSLSTELIYKTITGKELHEIIHDGEKSEREKRALIAKASRQLLGELASSTSLDGQKALNVSISQVVQDLLALTTFQARSVALQIWDLAKKESEMSHGVNVATMAVLFSMAFGRIEEDLLADIGMAGLLHDIGLTLAPLSLSQTPWTALTTEQMTDFARHEGSTADLIYRFGPEIPVKVRKLVLHHHGKYSSTKKTHSVAEISQLIAMADTVDSMCNGLWDGRERTMLEALLFLEGQELEAKEQRLFNEDVFMAVLRWIRGNIPETTLAEAISVVTDQLRSVKPRAG